MGQGWMPVILGDVKLSHLCPRISLEDYTLRGCISFSLPVVSTRYSVLFLLNSFSVELCK